MSGEPKKMRNHWDVVATCGLAIAAGGAAYIDWRWACVTFGLAAFAVAVLAGIQFERKQPRK